MPPLMDRPVLREVEYDQLDWETHPIDLVSAPQGWGPFDCAWQPLPLWHDPADDITDEYGHGESNEWQFAPPYDIITVYGDDSMDYEWDTSYDVVGDQEAAEDEVGDYSTIAQVVGNTGRQSMLSRLRTTVMGG